MILNVNRKKDHAEFDERVKRIRNMMIQPHGCPRIVLVNEMHLAIWTYYGTRRKAWAEITWCFVSGWWTQIMARFRCSISDRVGWTKLYEVQETAEYVAHKERHGRKCSGSPNCDNPNCIVDSVPFWFRFITGWRKYL